MPVLRDRHLFYVDSRTTAATVAYDTARDFGVRSAFRNVPFLDDVAEVAAVRKQLDWRCAAPAKKARPWPSAILTPRRSRRCARFCRKQSASIAWCSPPNSSTKCLVSLRLRGLLFSSPGKADEWRRQESHGQKAKMLPSGPPFRRSAIWRRAEDAFDRCPWKTMPLFGTEYRNVSPKSKLACHPTHNQRLPVRRKANAKISPIDTTPAAPPSLRRDYPNGRPQTSTKAQPLQARNRYHPRACIA